ncbi:MAG TPA: precorrin-3B C(17)-methyltransferase [Syntrophorhabdaceae bacterium]|jgi:cobalt-precorrin 5A hydrolase/precorrin-3B C17-methyltransferase
MSTENRTALFYITREGRGLGVRLGRLYPALTIRKFSRKAVEELWGSYGTLLFVMAAGIVVRTISGLMKGKRTDPAVILLDEKGQNVISLLSGHLGGANTRTKEIAAFLGAHAVITTGSDVAGLPSLDLWAREEGLAIEDWSLLPKTGARLLDKGNLNVYSGTQIDLPTGLTRVDNPQNADILITNRRNTPGEGLYLRPRNLVVGVGCNRGTSVEEIEETVRAVLDEHGFSFLSLFRLATIDIKTGEPGIKAFCARNSLELLSFTASELNGVAGITVSEAARRATGAKAVAEPSALLGAGAASLLVRKEKRGNVTVAVAERSKAWPVEGRPKGHTPPGRIYVVGIGPGGREHMTPRAISAIRDSEVIVGYGTYVALIRDLLGNKKVFSTGMTHEIERCAGAIQAAGEGSTVAVISGGDPGIYAMAGLVFELLMKPGDRPLPPVEVIPGISALNASAARLGAPLMHDFASVSLSDRLTSWETIAKRLEAAAMADFVIVLYNPRSRGRAGHLKKAAEIIAKHRAPATAVGIVRRAMREDESAVLTTLEGMLDHEIDMQTTVIIGNSKTFTWNNIMITPRGYEEMIASRQSITEKPSRG